MNHYRCVQNVMKIIATLSQTHSFQNISTIYDTTICTYTDLFEIIKAFFLRNLTLYIQ